MNLNSVRNANRKRLGSIELQPHYVTRRYAEFAASVLMLHHRLQDMALSDDMLLHNMYGRGRLRFACLLSRSLLLATSPLLCGSCWHQDGAAIRVCEPAASYGCRTWHSQGAVCVFDQQLRPGVARADGGASVFAIPRLWAVTFSLPAPVHATPEEGGGRVAEVFLEAAGAADPEIRR